MTDEQVRLVVACGMLIALLLVGAVTVMWLKKHIWGSDANPEEIGAGFTLGDLRQLHKSGKMTDAEFESAKAAVIVAAQKSAARAAQRREDKNSPPPMGGFGA